MRMGDATSELMQKKANLLPAPAARRRGYVTPLAHTFAKSLFSCPLRPHTGPQPRRHLQSQRQRRSRPFCRVLAPSGACPPRLLQTVPTLHRKLAPRLQQSQSVRLLLRLRQCPPFPESLRAPFIGLPQLQQPRRSAQIPWPRIRRPTTPFAFPKC